MVDLCGNRAATRVNDLNTREKTLADNSRICRIFASSRKMQQTTVLPTHGRGCWCDRASPTWNKLCFAGKTRTLGLCMYHLSISSLIYIISHRLLVLDV